jgi:hypothetical protein
MKHLAAACVNGSHNYAPCAKEAASGFTPGGAILLGVIVLIIVMWIRKK